MITADPGALPDLGPVAVHTPGSAKGLEFDVVVVVDPEAIAAHCPADLYVAMTRATRRLVSRTAHPLTALRTPPVGCAVSRRGAQSGA